MCSNLPTPPDLHNRPHKEVLLLDFIYVNAIWDAKAATSPWDCGPGDIWPADFLPQGWYHNRHVDEQPPPEYIEAAEAHMETINFWVGRFSPYVGRESQIPEDWAILMNGECLEDGYHRLTAAKIAGLHKIPYREYNL